MEIRKIADRDLFDGFVEQHPYGHYMKTSLWGEFKKRTENNSYEMLGFYEEDELIGTAMVLLARQFGADYAYIPWGPCIDYTDESVVCKAFDLLKAYADELHVEFLKTDPNVERVPHADDGHVIEGFNHEYVTWDLKSVGYKHKGYGYAYNGSWVNRYTLIKDLSGGKDAIMKGFDPGRKRSIKKHKTWCVSTHTGSREDIPHLMELEGQLVRQDGFKPHSKAFFEALLDIFGDHAHMYVTDINLSDMIEGIEKELPTKKYRSDPEAKQAAERNVERAKQLRSQFGDRPVLVCGLFISFGKSSWDLYTYNHKAFGFIQAVDNLHYYAMSDMIDHGVVHYDMVGFSGETTPYDPNYGLYHYKASFGPRYTEYIGEFDYIRNYGKVRSFRLRKSIQSHLNAKWYSIRYKRKTK